MREIILVGLDLIRKGPQKSRDTLLLALKTLNGHCGKGPLVGESGSSLRAEALNSISVRTEFGQRPMNLKEDIG